MANISIKSLWALEVEGQELTLISKALSGALKPGERKAAWELAKKIAEQRAKEARTLAEVAEGAFNQNFKNEPEGEE
jgi:hypothetical protein